MGILPILFITSFTLWTVLGKKPGGGLFQFSFLFSFLIWVVSILTTNGWSVGFPVLAISFLMLALYGFIIQKVITSDSGRIIIGILAISPFFYNPKPISTFVNNHIVDTIKLDPNAELIVKCNHDHLEEIRDRLSKSSFVRSVKSWDIANPNETELDDYLIIDVINDSYSYKFLQQIESIPGVDYIEKNEMWPVEISTKPSESSSNHYTYNVNDPRVKDQWSHEFLDMNKYHDYIQQSGIKPIRPAKLYILDSGVNFNHEDLKGTVRSHASIDKDLNERDKNGHGTHCAGIAAAVTNNGKGIASFNPGSDWVELGSVAVLNRFGLATQARIIEGMIEAADAGADVINMSFGGMSNQLKQEAYDDAFSYLNSKNIVVIAAAGNSAADASKYLPSGRNDVITVTALNPFNEKAQFSNFINNTNYGIAAPGTSILSSFKDGYKSFDGTSMAAPHVAGLVAVLRAIRPNLSTKEVFNILNKTGSKTKNTTSTGNCINPSKALNEVID